MREIRALIWPWTGHPTAVAADTVAQRLQTLEVLITDRSELGSAQYMELLDAEGHW